MVGGTTPPQSDSGEISRVLVLNLLWQSKRCSRTAQDISVLTTPSLLSMSVKSSIPPNLVPPLSGEALWMASKELKSKQQKLDWLQVAKELLQHPDSEIAVLLLKEIAATEHAAENSHS